MPLLLPEHAPKHQRGAPAVGKRNPTLPASGGVHPDRCRSGTTPPASRQKSELRDCYVGQYEYLAGSAEWVPSWDGRAAAHEVLNYFGGHRDRLNYALRLRPGQPIGSGLLEGACKQMIGRWRKQTGAL